MLFENGAVAQQVMEQSESRWKETRIQLSTMKNELSGLRENYSFFTVRAPFDGRVSAVSVNQGDVVTASQPQITLEDDSSCKVVVTVASGDLPSLRPQTPASIAYQDRRQACELTRVYPSTAGSGTGTVEKEKILDFFFKNLGNT